MGRARSTTSCKTRGKGGDDGLISKSSIGKLVKLFALCLMALLVDLMMDLILRKASLSEDSFRVTYLVMSANLILATVYQSLFKCMTILRLLMVSTLLALCNLVLLGTLIEEATLKDAFFFVMPLTFAKLLSFRLLAALQRVCKENGLFYSA